jgi:hypothetical protein
MGGKTREELSGTSFERTGALTYLFGTVVNVVCIAVLVFQSSVFLNDVIVSSIRLQT